MSNPRHSIVQQRHLTPGLWTLIVDGDGSAFNWEDLYVVLNQYGNVNQRTGPWDFNLLEANRPVLPAYWVFVNGRRIGLWYFNRPGFGDLAQKHFRGEASFWIREAGEYEFRFEPYREFVLSWAQAEFGPEPHDRLLDDLVLRPAAERGFQRRFDAGRWARLRERLADSSFPYGEILAEALRWARTKAPTAAPDASPLQHEQVTEQLFGSVPLPLLCAGFLLQHDEGCLRQAVCLIEHLLARPAWGNPREDGYGHNGDMGAAATILDLAIALNLLGDALAEPLRARLLARIEQQGETFLELALLHRGYWGGSILQDHGFCSFSFFTTAAYALLGWTPKARQWLRFCLPRMARTMAALPTDGAIPQSSYHMLALYTDKVVLFRELHRQATGEDVYDRPAWRNLPRFAWDSYLPEVARFLHASPRGDRNRFYGGHPFLDQMARDFGDAEAAWLAAEYVRSATSAGLYHAVQEQARFAWTLWAALLWEPVALPAPERLPQTLRRYQDSGAILYRHEASGLVFSARCGTPNGLTALQRATCGCDRLTFAPMSGTFALTRHGMPLIVNAEGGYRMRTGLGNVVLIDGQGQFGDHGPPMCCPDHLYRGEEITAAHLDEGTGQGEVTMALTPAYSPALGVTEHTREFRFEPDGSIRLTDRLATSAPRRFSWCFHCYGSCRITALGSTGFTLRQGDEALSVEAVRTSAPLRASVRDTLVVWAYCNENQDESFRHLEFENMTPQSHLEVEFTLR
jgi:hypothetical protein